MRSRRFLACLALGSLLWSSPSWAQNTPSGEHSPPTPRADRSSAPTQKKRAKTPPDHNDISGFGSGGALLARTFDQWTIDLCSEMGLIFQRRLTVGWQACAMASSVAAPGVSPRPGDKLSVGRGGILFGLDLYHFGRRGRLFSDVVLGAGMFALQNDAGTNERFGAVFLHGSVRLGASFDITQWVRVSAYGGFRGAASRSSNQLELDDLGSGFGGVSLAFGLF